MWEKRLGQDFFMCIDRFDWGTLIPWSSTTDKELFAVLGKSKIPAFFVKDTHVTKETAVDEEHPKEFWLYTPEARTTHKVMPMDYVDEFTDDADEPSIDWRHEEAMKKSFTPGEGLVAYPVKLTSKWIQFDSKDALPKELRGQYFTVWINKVDWTADYLARKLDPSLPLPVEVKEPIPMASEIPESVIINVEPLLNITIEDTEEPESGVWEITVSEVVTVVQPKWDIILDEEEKTPSTVEVKKFKWYIPLDGELFNAIKDTHSRDVKIFRENRNRYTVIANTKGSRESDKYMRQRWWSNSYNQWTYLAIRRVVHFWWYETASLKDDWKIHLPPGKMMQNLLGKNVTFDIYR